MIEEDCSEAAVVIPEKRLSRQDESHKVKSPEISKNRRGQRHASNSGYNHPHGNRTIPEAMRQALEHHQAGRLQEPRQSYRQVRLSPDHSDALAPSWSSGASGRTTKRPLRSSTEPSKFNTAAASITTILERRFARFRPVSEAIAAYRRATELEPNSPRHSTTSAPALQDAGRMEEAAAAFARAVELRPILPNLSNLGGTLGIKTNISKRAFCRRAFQADDQSRLITISPLAYAVETAGRSRRDVSQSPRACPPTTPSHNNLAGTSAPRTLDDAIDTATKPSRSSPTTPKHSTIWASRTAKGAAR